MGALRPTHWADSGPNNRGTIVVVVKAVILAYVEALSGPELAAPLADPNDDRYDSQGEQAFAAENGECLGTGGHSGIKAERDQPHANADAEGWPQPAQTRAINQPSTAATGPTKNADVI